MTIKLTEEDYRSIVSEITRRARRLESVADSDDAEYADESDLLLDSASQKTGRNVRNSSKLKGVRRRGALGRRAWLK